MKLLQLVIVLAISTSACRAGAAEAPEICPSASRYACAVPFESVYANRHELINKAVQLEGVVLVGVRSEPPGTTVPLALLFPSTERSEICNTALALQLTGSPRILEELRSASGGAVSIAGELALSDKGHWAQINVVRVSQLRTARGDAHVNCLNPEPPPAPPPES